jgi:hypothetical protein
MTPGFVARATLPGKDFRGQNSTEKTTNGKFLPRIKEVLPQIKTYKNG